MDTILWWSGLVFWCVINLIAAVALFEGTKAFVRTISFYRWSIRVMRANDRKPQWRHLPGEFFGTWWDMVGWDGALWRSGSSQWRGIGDYTVIRDPKANPTRGQADE